MFHWRDPPTYLDVLGIRLRDVLGDHVLGNVTLLASPEVWRLVKRVDDLEPIRVLLGELVPSFLEHWKTRADNQHLQVAYAIQRLTDVLLGNVCEHERPLGVVSGKLQRVSNHLVHGSDTTSTTDGETVSELVRLVDIFGDGALERQGLSGLEVIDVLRHLAVLRDEKEFSQICEMTLSIHLLRKP